MAANSLGDYGERLALDAASGVSPVDGRFIALFTDSINAAGTGTEVANANGYERKAVVFDAAATVGGSTTTDNNAEVLFNLCVTSNWGTIVSIGIYDSASYGAGNLIWYGDLTAAKLIEVNDQLRFAIGAVDLSMD